MLSVTLGLLIGLTLGAVGAGGSILTVPVLVLLLGQDIHAATATSLAVVGVTALSGSVAQWRRGRVLLRTVIPFGIAGIGGAFVGAWTNHLLPGWIILSLFGLLMLLVAARMYLSTTIRRDDASPPSRTSQSWPRMLGAGLVVGIMTGFFGVGGGFLIVPALVLVVGMSMRSAVGTSLAIIALNSASGLAAHLQYGSLDLTVAALFALGGTIGAVIGSAIGDHVDERRLQQAFAGIVASVGLVLLLVNLPLTNAIA